VQWFENRGRDFPWRGEDPYSILLAELLLRQTKAEQVVPVWQQLIREFPTVETIARVDPSHISTIVHGLGFAQQRSSAIHGCFSSISSRHGGVIPCKLVDLVALPHVGLYTSHAVACFAFDQQVPVVDSNVLRVLGRLVGKDFGKDNRRSPDAWLLAARILPRGLAQTHNYGLLDFSAQVCTSRRPKHHSCPLKSVCLHYFNEMIV
jgi:A/G-specific adenine glycosylase